MDNPIYFYECLLNYKKQDLWGDDNLLVSKYGADSKLIFRLWNALLEDKDIKWKPYHLLMALGYLKQHTVQRSAASYWKVSVDCYMKWVKRVITTLENNLEDINLHNRYSELGIKYGFNLALDTTLCPIQKPTDSELEKSYFSSKLKKCGIKYQIGCRLDNGYICWIGRPYRGGEHDCNITRLDGIIDVLEDNEAMIVDMGYYGVDEKSIHPIKSRYLSKNQNQYNKIQSSMRKIIENVNSRLKSFKILDLYRGEVVKDLKPYYTFHSTCFFLIAKIINIQILNLSKNKN